MDEADAQALLAEGNGATRATAGAAAAGSASATQTKKTKTATAGKTPSAKRMGKKSTGGESVTVLPVPAMASRAASGTEATASGGQVATGGASSSGLATKPSVKHASKKQRMDAGAKPTKEEVAATLAGKLSTPVTSAFRAS